MSSIISGWWRTYSSIYTVYGGIFGKIKLLHKTQKICGETWYFKKSPAHPNAEPQPELANIFLPLQMMFNCWVPPAVYSFLHLCYCSEAYERFNVFRHLLLRGSTQIDPNSIPQSSEIKLFLTTLSPHFLLFFYCS